MTLAGIGKNAAFYTVGNIANKAVSFLLLPIYTKYLSVAEYGSIELIELTINVLTIIIGLGAVSSAMIRIYHEMEGARNKKNVISSATVAILAISIALWAIGHLFSELIATAILHDISYTNLISLAFFAIVLSAQVEVCLIYIRIQERPLFYITYSFAQLLILVAFNIFFIVGLGLGIWGFVYSKIITFGMGLLVLWFYVFRETGLSCDFSILKKIFRFGIPLIGASLAFFIIHFSDRFFLSYFTGLDEVGIYSLGYKFGFLITFLVGEPFGRAWNVKLFEYAKNEGWQLRFASVFLFFFLALFITWAGVAFFSHDIIKVIANQQFQGAALVIPGVALGYLFREAGDFFKNILFINKKSGLVSKISISCATINLLLNYGLIQICGMIGAVLSTVATWLTYSLLLFYFSQRTHHIPYRPYPFIMVGLFGGLLYTLVLCFPLEYLPASIGLHLLLYAPILIVCSIIALNEYRSFQYNA